MIYTAASYPYCIDNTTKEVAQQVYRILYYGHCFTRIWQLRQKKLDRTALSIVYEEERMRWAARSATA